MAEEAAQELAGTNTGPAEAAATDMELETAGNPKDGGARTEPKGVARRKRAWEGEAGEGEGGEEDEGDS